MERFRRRKSKNYATIEGYQQIQKQKTPPKPARGCVSCGRPITVENSYFKEELDATDRVTVTPMKKLLASEMSKETEGKRQSPSVIARLMGLDGLPAQPFHRHKKALSDDFELRKNAQVYGRSSRSSSMEQQNFKDVYVYEDLEMEIIQRKYMKMEKNDCITEKWVRGSREFPKALNLKKELMMKAFQRPDSSYVTHRPDLKGAPSTSRISPRKHDDSLLSHSYNDCSAHISSKARFEVRGETENDIFPAKIVVLKPNIGKMCNAGGPGTSLSSSPYSYHADPSDYTRRLDYSSVRGKNLSIYEVGSASDNARRLEYSSARGKNLSSNEVGSPSDYTRRLEYSSARGKNLSSNEVGSSRHKAKEAKDCVKKILRRTRRENISHWGSGGGYAGDVSSYSSDNSEGESENSFARSNRNSSRSRSVPPVIGCRSPKESGKHEAFVDDRLLMPKEAGDKGKAKAVKGSFNQKEDYSPKNIIISSKRRSDSIRHRHGYKELKASQTPNGVSAGNSENDSIQVPSSASDEDLPLLSAARGQEPSSGPSTVVECPKPEPEFLQSSKENDQPSPVSVLEAPRLVDVSYGSECFERVSADLHELRLKCQLLKMESNTYPKVGPTLLPFDEENETSLTISPSKETFSSSNWESLYLSAVLVESRITENDPNTFTPTWPSRDYPLAPYVFEDLEKYYDESHVPKPERKLLFDRINSGLLEIFSGLVDQCPWVGPTRGSKKVDCVVKDEVELVLARQVEEANVDLSVKVLDREMSWLGFRGEFDVIGTEIEKLLVDDLIMEVLG